MISIHSPFAYEWYMTAFCLLPWFPAMMIRPYLRDSLRLQSQLRASRKTRSMRLNQAVCWTLQDTTPNTKSLAIVPVWWSVFFFMNSQASCEKYYHSPFIITWFIYRHRPRRSVSITLLRGWPLFHPCHDYFTYERRATAMAREPGFSWHPCTQ